MSREAAADSLFGLLWYLWTSEDDALEKCGWFFVFIAVRLSLALLELYDYTASGLIGMLAYVRKRADTAKRD